MLFGGLVTVSGSPSIVSEGTLLRVRTPNVYVFDRKDKAFIAIIKK
jgi:hypothetical protein